MQPVQGSLTMDARVLQEAAEYIKEHEGLSLKPYYCTANKLSIGIGRNLDDRGITKEEAMFLFNTDIKLTLSDLYRVFDDFDMLPNQAQVVLLDMMFQLGLIRFCGFQKMIEQIKARNWEEAAKELMDSKYAKQVPKRAEQNRDRLLSIK